MRPVFTSLLLLSLAACSTIENPKVPRRSAREIYQLYSADPGCHVFYIGSTIGWDYVTQTWVPSPAQQGAPVFAVPRGQLVLGSRWTFSASFTQAVEIAHGVQ